MRSAPLQLGQLRQLIAERFPAPAVRRESFFATGVAELDLLLGGGFYTGALTEIISRCASSGGQSLIAQLLKITRARQQRVALIDAMDAFDPQSHEPDQLEHLIWVRCHQGKETIQAADILLRDANLALAIIDMRGAALADLRRIPSTAWYRLQRAVEPTSMAVIVQSTFPLVPSAQVRLELDKSFSLDACEQEQ